ncbi:MAG TPA: hypothetical protein VHQ65_08230 [Thermoanaerobaculia bacterium]|nr:hypothetical protein [Thermoanaerobaculia bacterium]
MSQGTEPSKLLIFMHGLITLVVHRGQLFVLFPDATTESAVKDRHFPKVSFRDHSGLRTESLRSREELTITGDLQPSPIQLSPRPKVFPELPGANNASAWWWIASLGKPVKSKAIANWPAGLHSRARIPSGVLETCHCVQYPVDGDLAVVPIDIGGKTRAMAEVMVVRADFTGSLQLGRRDETVELVPEPASKVVKISLGSHPEVTIGNKIFSYHFSHHEKLLRQPGSPPIPQAITSRWTKDPEVMTCEGWDHHGHSIWWFLKPSRLKRFIVEIFSGSNRPICPIALAEPPDGTLVENAISPESRQPLR